ncbi:hypothetical protein [Salinigranum rubrum]|uniref:hypothetical protein n=1 Tax=Salinigranum rubrum TaxID=755307 RepID=UPI001FEAB168|nr:hypothetical protein [Salinigranum rubrum]
MSLPSAAARATERVIRAGIVAVLVVGVRRRDPGAVVNAVLALAGSYLPNAIERRYPVRFHPWQRVYTETAMLTHAVGMLGPYDDVWWWDHLTHVHTATLLGGVSHAVARRAGYDPRPHVVAGVVGGGALWEVVEYVTHGLSRRVGFDPVLVSYGRVDTALDLVFDLLGALVVVALGDGLLENFHDDDSGVDETDHDRVDPSHDMQGTPSSDRRSS